MRELPINEIICGDCIIVMQEFPDECIDMVLTSPPYDNFRYYNGFQFKFEPIAKELYRVIKPGGVVVWVAGDETIDGSETGTSFKQCLFFKEIGFNLHDTMIYAKNSFAFPSKNRYHQVFEYMFVFSKGKPKCFNPIKDKPNLWDVWGRNTGRERNGKIKTYRDSEPSKGKMGMRYNIWLFKTGGCGFSSKDKIAYEHPAIFPEQLANDHIISWSDEGDLILDPMCGSGTTCKMAKVNNRRFIGIDIHERYCEISRQRVASVPAVLELNR